MLSPTNEQLKTAIEIADHYGLESRIAILQEECAELIQAVSKLRRLMDSGLTTQKSRVDLVTVRSNVAEEMADVQILLLELDHLLEIDPLVEFQIDYKLRRTMSDIQKEEAHEQNESES